MSTKTAFKLPIVMRTRSDKPKLDDDGGPIIPPFPPDFSRNPGGWGWPLWASHITCLLMGAVSMNVAYLYPVLLPVVFIVFGSLFALFAVLGTRRWK